MLCKRCQKELSGLQKSYCSIHCSKLHLKSLYRKRNRTKVSEYNRNWKILNPEKWKLQHEKYYLKKFGRLPGVRVYKSKEDIFYEISCGFCPDKVFISKRKRKKCPLHSRKGKKALRFEILKRDNFTCKYCGRSSPSVILQVDHIVPFSKGGISVSENLVTSCFDCNIGKRDILLS